MTWQHTQDIFCLDQHMQCLCRESWVDTPALPLTTHTSLFRSLSWGAVSSFVKQGLWYLLSVTTVVSWTPSNIMGWNSHFHMPTNVAAGICTGNIKADLPLLHSIWGPHYEDSTTRVAWWLGTRSPGSIFIHMSGGSYWLLARTSGELSAGYLYWPHLHCLSMWLPCMGWFELPHNMAAGFPEQGRSAWYVYNLSLEVTWYHFPHTLYWGNHKGVGT